MKRVLHSFNNAWSGLDSLSTLCIALMFVSMMLIPGLVLADDGFGETSAKVCGFFTNINSILNMVSITVVTIAVVFSGYQIAFAHKRIADVAPILLGGVLIGAASQLAKMLVGDSTQQCQAVSSMVMHYLLQYHA